MPDLLRCTDPKGRVVVLTRERWERVILSHRPELRHRMDLVADSITAPWRITSDRDDRSWWFYYRRAALPPPYDGFLMRVLVIYRRRLRLRLLTGLVEMVEFVNRPLPREDLQWPPTM